MTSEKEKTTVPESLVGASAGQPNELNPFNSIPDCIKEINEEDEISLENLSMEELEAM